MAKEKINKKDVDYGKTVEQLNIADACKGYMQVFGANNNLMRHLPEIYDGLKIGERRILYTMYEMGLSYNKPHNKSSNIVGRTMGLYHPHGDAAIYDTLVKLAQPWNNIQVLIDKKGNFGSQSGEPAAASRYTECRLSFYAYKCFFEEFSPNYTDMRDNYLHNAKEPEVLPSKYPNVLINSSFGIGYGIATSIPTYNFKEVCETTIELIKNPDYDDFILIPDSPTGSYVMDDDNFEEITKTGTGRFRMRGVIEINHDLNALEVRSTPILTTWMKIKKPLIEMITSKGNLLEEIRDMSTLDTFHYRITLKKEVDPVSVMNEIYSKTQMEKTFGVRFKLTEDYMDTDYNIRSLLLTWIDFRRESKRRIYAYKYTEAKERQHILEILLFILNKDNAENTVTLIKNSANRKEAAKKLMKTYGISSLQAEYIADMKMSAFTKDAYAKYIDEKKKIDNRVIELDKILRSKKKIDKIIIEELEEGIKLFGAERQSKIMKPNNDIQIQDTSHIVVFTLNGMVKKLPLDVDNIGTIAPGDFPVEVVPCKNTSDLLIFDEKGKIFKLPVSDIPGSTLVGHGTVLSTLRNLTGAVVTSKPKPTSKSLSKIKEPVYFIMVTKNGLIKKTSVEAYMNIRNELIGMNIKDDDALVCCKLLTGDSDIIVYSDKGYGVRFNTSEINETGRLSVGVKAMILSDDEHIIGLDILNTHDQYILVITDKGNCKKCSLKTFSTMTRNSKPLKIVSIEAGDSVKVIRTVRGNEVFNVYTKNGMGTISVADDVIELPRLSKGKKLIPVRKGDTIINIKETLK